jgi:hypothetical protein
MPATRFFQPRPLPGRHLSGEDWLYAGLAGALHIAT